MKVKIKASDELKLIKSISRIKPPVKQIHKSKKAYSRHNKHKLILDI